MLDIRGAKPDAPAVQYNKSTYKLRMRKRSSTSVEDLSSDTEAIYERDEREALEAAEAKVQDYHGVTSSRRDAEAIPMVGRRSSTRMAIERAKS
jgi:hypothetical protein